MADSTSNVTIHLRVASQAQDRTNLQATAAGLNAVRVATQALTKEEAARAVAKQDLTMRERQQGQISQADEHRAQQSRNVQVQSARQQGVAPVDETIQPRQAGWTVLQQAWQRQQASIDARRERLQPDLPGAGGLTAGLDREEGDLRARQERYGQTRTERIAAWQRRQMTAGPLTTGGSAVGVGAPADTRGMTPGGMSQGTYRGLQIRQEAYKSHLEKIQTELAGRPPLTNLRTWDLSRQEKGIQERLSKVQTTLARPMAPPIGGEDTGAAPAGGGRPPRRPPVPPIDLGQDEYRDLGAGYRPRQMVGQMGMRALGTGLGMVGLGGTFTGMTMEFGRHMGGSFGARFGGAGGGPRPPSLIEGGGAGSSLGAKIMQGAATGAGIGGTLGLAGGPAAPVTATGGAALGAFLGALGGLVTGLVIDKVIDKTTQALGRYEDRVRTAGRLTQYLSTPYEAIDETIEHMRVNQHAMAADTLSAMQGISRYVGKVDQGMTATALRTARAFGISEEQGGEMVGQMARLMTPGGRPSNLASFQQARAYPGIADAQFMEQAIGIAGAGGVDMPTMTPSYAGRMANFLGGMGQRFPGQQAQVFGQLQGAQSGQLGGMTGMIRYRAIENLRRKLPGGILTIGDERIDLNTLRGQRQALEQASQSGAVMEEIASESERLGGGVPGLGDELIHQTLLPGASVFRAGRFMRERRKLGPAGLRRLDEPGEAGIGKEMEDLLIKGMSPQYEKLLIANAGVEQALNKTVSALFDTKTDINKALADATQAGPIKGIFDWMTGNGQAVLDKLGTALSDLNTTLKQMGGTWGDPTQQLAPANPPSPWRPPPDPRVNPQRNQ